MNTSKKILNDLLTIGGVATKNNFYSNIAKTQIGMFIQTNRYFNRYAKDGLIRQIPTITRVRNKRQETFYAITGKGASYIGRRDELKNRDPKSPNNVMHESMKFDIALSFVRNFPDYDINIKYEEAMPSIRPDITIRMKHRFKNTEYHFLVEIERKKTIDKVYDKVLKYEEALKGFDFNKFSLSPSVKILIIYADTKFDGFLRPVEHSTDYCQKEIKLIEKRVAKLAEMAKNTNDKYRFLPFSSFHLVNCPVWINSKNHKVSIVH